MAGSAGSACGSAALSEARLASLGHSSVIALQQKARYLITVSFVVCTADTTEQRVDFTTLKFLTKQSEIGFAFSEGKTYERRAKQPGSR